MQNDILLEEAKLAFQQLDLSFSADIKEIKKTFKKLSLEWHPDKNPGYHEKYVTIKNAYEFLLNNPDLIKELNTYQEENKIPSKRPSTCSSQTYQDFNFFKANSSSSFKIDVTCSFDTNTKRIHEFVTENCNDLDTLKCIFNTAMYNFYNLYSGHYLRFSAEVIGFINGKFLNFDFYNLSDFQKFIENLGNISLSSEVNKFMNTSINKTSFNNYKI